MEAINHRLAKSGRAKVKASKKSRSHKTEEQRRSHRTRISKLQPAQQIAGWFDPDIAKGDSY